MFNQSCQYWVPMLPYWIIVDTIIILASTIVGVSVFHGLMKARLPMFADTLGK